MRYEDELVDLVKQYHRELQNWYTSAGIRENPFTTTTQDLWYQHYLNKKRLDRLGINMKYESRQSGELAEALTPILSDFDTHYDGRVKITAVRDAMNYCKRYSNSNTELYVQEVKDRIGQYFIMQSKTEQGQYVCPKCGNIGTLESMIDGCDYCGSKFQMMDFNGKISSSYVPPVIGMTRNKQSLVREFLPFVVLTIIPIMILQGVSFIPSFANLIPIFYSIAAICFLPLFLKGRKFLMERGTKNAMRVIDQIHYNDPYFSEEAMLGGIMNKLMAIHYATNQSEVAPYVLCDITKYLKRYQNILDCNLLQYKLLGYEEDKQFSHITLEVDLQLVGVENAGCAEKKEHIRLHLIKKSALHSNLVNDVVIYTCPTCGNSISLWNGGRCEACGRTMNLPDYDWTIKEYIV